MCFFNRVIIIIAVLFYYSQIVSAALVKYSKYYDNAGKQVTGRNYFDDTTITYTYCEKGLLDQTLICNITIEFDAFEAHVGSRSCKYTLMSDHKERGVFDVLGVDLWGKDKAVFVWREKEENSSYAFVKLQTVFFRDCNSVINTITVNNLGGMEPQIFIETSMDTYDVFFINNRICDQTFSKMTIDQTGSATKDTECWFTNKNIVFDLIPIKELPAGNNYFVGVHDYKDGKMKFNLVLNNKKNTLKIYDKTDALAWSTSHGRITICSPDTCARYTHSGTYTGNIQLIVVYRPRLFAALYNLFSGEMLALTCHISNQDSYYIMKISLTGMQGKGLNLDDLKCNRKPSSLHAKFFMVDSQRFCLSVFHPVYTADLFGKNKFAKYCFSLNDLE